MSEQTPRYENPRDQLLWTICENGWANASSGDVAAPMGKFYRISNSEAELVELVQAFADTLREQQFDTPAQLFGNFLVRSDDQGFVDVFEYENPDDLIAEFDTLKQYYEEWARDGA